MFYEMFIIIKTIKKRLNSHYFPNDFAMKK